MNKAVHNLSPEALAEMDQAHALHPWAHFDSFEREGPMVMSRGDGCHLWDAEGRKYFDAVGGLWCTNIGLGRAEMANAIAEQAQRLAFANTFVDITNDPAAMLAAKLAEIAPDGLSRVHFTTGGSTAVDSAYRLVHFAQAAMGRPKKRHILSRKHSYHGSTFASMSIGMRDGDRAEEFTYIQDGITHLSAPRVRPGDDPNVVLATCLKELEDTIQRIGADNIAAFFAEPVQASGGVIIPPDGYLRRMVEICRKHDILFVADEVVTGFGRLGEWFAADAFYGAKPDVICCAKGLSSGYQPIGAVIFSDQIWQAMASDKDRWFTSGFTYSGHPVACAASLKNIEIMEREGLLANAAEVGRYFQTALASLSEKPIVGETRGVGLIACVENVADKATMRHFDEDVDIARRISDAAERLGLMVRPMGANNVMSPPLILSKGNVDFIVETLGAAIDKVTDGLVRDGVRIA